ncbi:MAG TPA: hypothetical protein VHW96_02825 [Solirubrobacteraceae bacterium]|nr:hypothetical protein [Solirubrobacteraceae bacterium]
MSTRAIRTSTAQAACDVCGRTLLRGERAEIYLGGGVRRSVCELCTSRALHGGWVREGEVPEYDEASARPDRRRSLFGRRRNKREARETRDPHEAPGEDQARGAGEALSMTDMPAPEPMFDEEPPTPPPPSARPPRRAEPSSPSWPAPVSRAASKLGGAREPRHVRAVPTSIEHKISSAVSLFNDSEHPRTVAGIARSLGLPDVSVHPSDANGSVVHVVVSWELCWYRYEMDLRDEVPTVRGGDRGYELSELSEIERQNNAAADERGRLHLNG